MEPLEHDELLVSATHGDNEALALLVQRYHDRVHRFGLRVCRDRFDADDAVQEAFLKLAARPDVQQHQGALSWLMTVVKNACLRLLRPFARRRPLLGEGTNRMDEIPSDAPSADLMLERWQLVHRVYEAIAALPPVYRQVLVLRDLEGLTGEETATKLGIPEPTMKTRLLRARAMMRTAITGDIGAIPGAPLQ